MKIITDKFWAIMLDDSIEIETTKESLAERIKQLNKDRIAFVAETNRKDLSCRELNWKEMWDLAKW